MSKALVSKTKAGKLRASDAFAAAVAAEFAKGSTLPETIRALDSRTKKKTIHLVSPIYWRLAAAKAGKLDPTPKAILAARKAGARREVVALRSGLSVAKVREIETAGRRKPIYTGRGTKKHLAAA